MSLFDNMKVAYADKSDRDLNRAYFLFKIISNPFVTKILTFFMKVSIGIGLPIKGLIKATVYKQFCGGTTIKSSQKTIEKFFRRSLNNMVEFWQKFNKEEILNNN